jgi:hypothetical protein
MAPLIAQSPAPIIIKLVDRSKSSTDRVIEILVGALGLTGALALAALVCGAALAGVMFWMRRRG